MSWRIRIATPPKPSEPRKTNRAVSLGRLGVVLGFRLRRVQNQLSRDFQVRTKAWDLRSGMFSSLEIIATNPGISQTALAREIGMDKSVVVSLIDELGRRGWTVRERSPTDRRFYQLSITPEGAAVLEDLIVATAEAEMPGRAALSAAEFEMLSKSLDKIYAAYVLPRSARGSK